MTKKDSVYIGSFFSSIVLTLVFHYFFLNPLDNLDSTLGVFLSFVVFTVIMGIIISYLDRKR